MVKSTPNEHSARRGAKRAVSSLPSDDSQKPALTPPSKKLKVASAATVNEGDDGEEKIGQVKQNEEKKGFTKSVTTLNAGQAKGKGRDDVCPVCGCGEKEGAEGVCVECEQCQSWYHWSCVAPSVSASHENIDKWFCTPCTLAYASSLNPHTTIYKSSPSAPATAPAARSSSSNTSSSALVSSVVATVASTSAAGNTANSTTEQPHGTEPSELSHAEVLADFLKRLAEDEKKRLRASDRKHVASLPKIASARPKPQWRKDQEAEEAAREEATKKERMK